jgi:hypothetical protein
VHGDVNDSVDVDDQDVNVSLVGVDDYQDVNVGLAQKPPPHPLNG